MKIDFELNTALEDLYFKYERIAALISIMQMYVGECVDIVGAPENAVDYSLYEIELGIREANEELKDIISNGCMIEKQVEKLKSA